MRLRPTYMHLVPRHPGTLVEVSRAVDDTIDYERPAGITNEEVKRTLLVHWVRAELPKGWWARLRFWWRLRREVQR